MALWKVWKLAPQCDRVAELRELFQQEDFDDGYVLVCMLSDSWREGTLAAVNPGAAKALETRFIENRYGVESPLSRQVLRHTLDYIADTELQLPPSDVLLTEWLVDGALRWDWSHAQPPDMSPKLRPGEVADVVARSSRDSRFPPCRSKYHYQWQSEHESMMGEVSATKIGRWIKDHRQMPLIERLLEQY